MLIIDEVQTGFGRTGAMFACEQFVTPDILCLAKSLAGGIPMGTVICSDRIKVPVKSHTSTFGGNPTACAAALACLEVIEKEGLIKNAETLGNYLIEQLRGIESKKIRDIRGLGLMVGIELKEKAEATYGEVLQKVEATTEDLRKKTEEISAKVDEVIAQGKEELAKVTKKGKEAPEEAASVEIPVEGPAGA